MKKLLLLLFPLLFSGYLLSQTVEGIVSDQSGYPLIGVNILSKNAQSNTITDMDGKFKISVKGDDELTFSYIGYESLTLKAKQQFLNVVMIEKTTSLQEVVVVGYGTKKAGSITGSVAQIKSDDIVKTPAQSAIQSEKNKMLQQKLTELKNQNEQLQTLAISTDSSKLINLYELIMKEKLLKTDLVLYDLNAHLKDKILNNNDSNKEHYISLRFEVEKMQQQISTLDISNTNSVLLTAEELKKSIVPLKKQTTFTLLRMRIVEIGTPILLSLLSFFFILKYTLTEKRSLEIKELLSNRNTEN